MAPIIVAAAKALQMGVPKLLSLIKNHPSIAITAMSAVGMGASYIDELFEAAGEGDKVSEARALAVDPRTVPLDAAALRRALHNSKDEVMDLKRYIARTGKSLDDIMLERRIAALSDDQLAVAYELI